MSAEIYKCNYCKYESSKKFNLYRHTVAKHKNNNNNNNNNISQNIILENKKDIIINQSYKCNKCNKILASKYSLNRHSNICKGVENALICHLYNKKFGHYNSKYKHIKKCKGINNDLTVINDLNIKPNESISNDLNIKPNESFSNDLNIKINELLSNNLNIKPNESFSNDLNIKINELLSNNLNIKPNETFSNDLNIKINELLSNDSNINKNTTNNIINNNNNNNCNNTYNINLIIYDKEYDTFDFDLKHLNFNFVYKLTSTNEDDAFNYYCDKLFENKNNQMIIKSNFRNKYSKIHLSSNVWENFLDQHIYPKMMSLISETMITYINEHSKNKKNIKHLDHYLQIMASDGYSNSETQEYKKKYKNNIDMLKILFNSFM